MRNLLLTQTQWGYLIAKYIYIYMEKCIFLTLLHLSWYNFSHLLNKEILEEEILCTSGVYIKIYSNLRLKSSNPSWKLTSIHYSLLTCYEVWTSEVQGTFLLLYISKCFRLFFILYKSSNMIFKCCSILF